MRGYRHSPELQAKAVARRAEGHSLQEISDQLCVPKNTIQGWVRRVVLTETQRHRLESKAVERAAYGRPLAVIAWQRKIEAWKQSIEGQVSHIGPLPFSDSTIAKLTCGLLYICEGAKYPTTQGVGFANTDPRMIACFLNLLRREFAIDESKLRIRVMHRWDQDGEILREFWSKVTRIPIAQSYRSYADRRTKGHPTRQAGYHGVCCLHYPSTAVQYQLQAIGESVLKSALSQQPTEGTNLVAEAGAPPYSTIAFPEREPLVWSTLKYEGWVKRSGGAGGDRTLGLDNAIVALCPAELLPRE